MGWEMFTDAIISAISAELKGVVFILWGCPAQKKAKLIDLTRHPAPIKAAHPKAGSPGTDVGHGVARSWGRRRSMGPQESMTRARAARAEWKP
jgi:hypothetical protein